MFGKNQECPVAVETKKGIPGGSRLPLPGYAPNAQTCQNGFVSVSEGSASVFVPACFNCSFSQAANG
ncbi:hypothetical protein GCM10027018_23450 [Paenibacillus thermoaerophilus]